MLQYLPDTIQTFSSQSRKTVSSLIKSIKTDKSQISSLVANLKNFDFQANYSPALAIRYSPLNIEGVVEFFRDSSLRVNQLFSASSSISNIINSMVSIFSSEIEKVEKDIKYLENFINNYQFIAGEDDLFNFNYIENFDNDLNSHKKESSSITLFDRDGINFQDNGNYNVDPVLSKISISSGKNFVNVLDNYTVNKYITNYNKEQYVTTDTGFDAVLNEDPIDSWTVTVKSPYLLDTQIPNISNYVSYDTSLIRGAQSLVEVSFNAATESDFIRITPNDSEGLQILQVIVEGTSYVTSGDSSSTAGEYIKIPVLSSPLSADKSVDVLYPNMFVSKITFIFNQSRYIRSENISIVQESNSKFLSQIIDKARQQKLIAPSRVQDLVYYYFKRSSDINSVRKNKKNHTEVYSYRYPSMDKKPSSAVSSLILDLEESEIQSRLVDIVDDKNKTAISNIVQSIVQHAIDSRSNIFSSNVYRSNSAKHFGNKISSIGSDGIIPSRNENPGMELYFQKEDPQAPSVSSLDVTKYLNSRESTNNYEYSFSLKSLSIGKTDKSPQSKACFISNKIQTNGTPLAVKAIVNKVVERKNLNYFKYDLRESGSYELSVCLKDSIESENDWIPLAGSNDLNVDSEVLFINSLGLATLRHYPVAATINVYKNGLLENPTNWSYTQTTNQIQYLGNLDSSAIYVCEYEIDKTIYNQAIIDLDSISDSNFVIQSFVKDGRPGEYFSSTISGNIVNLTYAPFIEDRFVGAYYNDIYGTVTTGTYSGYSPVSVVFEDGSTAINLTNYTASSFIKAPFYATSDYLFYHNGKNIVFNRPVTSPFRVIYKYLPSNLRFRLILRDNIPDQIGNLSVDNVIIKCKVKNLDPLSEKLLRLK